MQNQRTLHEVELEINNREILKQNFISFLKNGGLFIPKDGYDYTIGEELQIKLKLFDEPDIFEFIAKVIWLPAKEITDPFTRGIGIEFCEPHHETLRNKLELYIAGAGNSKQRK